MLLIKNLSAGYKDLEVLKNVSLQLPQGKISILMGPNGAGKSTLLRSIFQLTEIHSGKILFDGLDITHAPTHERIDLGISFVPQGRVNFGILTVEENLFLGAHRISEKELKEKSLQKVYKIFPILQPKKNERAFSLSGGQQQMLALGRALMTTPKILLLDEPSLGLSPRLVGEVFQKIREINQEFGTTILVVEHNLKSALEVVDYGYVMVQGEIIAEDSSEKLKKSDILKQVFVGKLE